MISKMMNKIDESKLLTLLFESQKHHYHTSLSLALAKRTHVRDYNLCTKMNKIQKFTFSQSNSMNLLQQL